MQEQTKKKASIQANKLNKDIDNNNNTYYEERESFNDITPEELNLHFQNLFNVEIQQKEAIFLSEYFYDTPFLQKYNPELLTSLLNFFQPQSQYSIEGVNAAARIFSALFDYAIHYKQNDKVYEFMNNDFYLAIWQYFTQSQYVMLAFEKLLMLEQRSRYPTAFNFLMANNVFNVVQELLKPDYIFLNYIFLFIGRFVFYPQCYINVLALIPKICELTFTSNVPQVSSDGKHCLETFGREDIDIGILILNDRFFQEKCTDFQDINNLKSTLYMIDEIFQNKASIIKEGGIYNYGSAFRTQAKPLNPFFMDLICNIVNIPNVESDLLRISLSILSSLYLSADEVNHLIQIGFSKQLFDIVCGYAPYQDQVAAFSALCLLVESANKEAISYFIESGFIDLIGQFIDELMIDIPNQILDALETINREAETHPDCQVWNNIIFDNDDIVKALEKAENNEYPERDDYMITLQEHATSLLSRRYNEID